MGVSFKKFTLFFSLLLNNHFRIPKGNKAKHNSRDAPAQLGLQKLAQRADLENQVLVFNVERVLLRSSSLFPYFMLVSFEAGSLLRALILLILYPFICLLREDLALKAMVLVSFLGLKKDRFTEGRAVLPKFLLEDVGMESFEVVRKGKITVAISDLPRVMVESFLRDYLSIDFVVGRELESVCGYFVGLMGERRNQELENALIESSNVIGIRCLMKSSSHCEWFSHCKEIYLVSEEERSEWQKLRKESYPKPLIFHDGRMVFRPMVLATVAMFIWLPMGLILGIFRIFVSLTLPNWIKFPILHLTGVNIRIFNSPNVNVQEMGQDKGVLYVCNHRSLLDPLLVSFCIKTPLTAVVYSLSRISEIISPIKTVRLTRNRDRDAELMKRLLSQGDLAVCPEGTTCREPYLLRFSPLFSEITDRVFPIAIDYCYLSMFYGTTARGFKCLDPLFVLMNPRPGCSVHFLDMVKVGGECSKYEMANLVQELIAKKLGFTCTRLTRKDKYLILAGNEGLV